MNDEKEVQVTEPEQDLSDVPAVIKEHWKNIKKLSPGELITWEELMLN